MRFADKVAIVTGGGRDIGRAVSLRLAREGAKVVLNYLNDTAAAETTAAEIRAAGGEVLVHRADMSKADEVEGLIAAARAAYGDRIDVLVTLAGGMVARKPLAEMDEAFFDAVLDLNLKSAFLTIKAARPFMGEGSAIITFSSQAGRDGGGPGAIAYATSKGALLTMTRGLAKELGPRGIRVNAVCPGMIATTFHDIFTKAEVRQNVAAATPLRRQGESEDVAAAVAFLASDDGAFVTGIGLDVNGGTWFS
ncbi:MAG: glucose 1-dehydrogenase [Sphingomonas sp.]|nr:glucose 1-dehydrogenase [Sphingomonas sp.]